MKPEAATAPLVRKFSIINKRGLHARASARFVATVSAHKAEVRVRKDGLEVDGSSILDLMMLAASPGCVITVEAEGPEAAQVLDALDQLIAERFGEED